MAVSGIIEGSGDFVSLQPLSFSPILHFRFHNSSTSHHKHCLWIKVQSFLPLPLFISKILLKFFFIPLLIMLGSFTYCLVTLKIEECGRKWEYFSSGSFRFGLKRLERFELCKSNYNGRLLSGWLEYELFVSFDFGSLRT